MSAEVVDVSGWESLDLEPMGKKDKRWLVDESGTHWLFKEARIKLDVVRGEDWAEFLVAGIAGELGIPAPQTRLAQRDGRRGIISKDFVPQGRNLVHGNELLAGTIAGYDQDKTGENRLYTVAAVLSALEGTEAPATLRADGFSAADTWLYFLVLDALVANTDRHHMNWGVIESDASGRVLAPSFDHGTALGFQVPDEECVRSLQSDGVESWCLRGRARTFANRPNLLDLANEAWDMAQPGAQTVLRSRLTGLDLSTIERAISEIPTSVMSDCSRRFAFEVIKINRRRLLNVFAAAGSTSSDRTD